MPWLAIIEPWCAAWFLLSKGARTTEQSAAVGLKRGSNMPLGQTPGQTDRLRSRFPARQIDFAPDSKIDTVDTIQMLHTVDTVQMLHMVEMLQIQHIETQ